MCAGARWEMGDDHSMIKLPSDIDPGHEHDVDGEVNVFRAVRDDLRERDIKGWMQHEKALRVADMSEDEWLVNLYEELLDSVIYMKGLMLRRRARGEQTNKKE